MFAQKLVWKHLTSKPRTASSSMVHIFWNSVGCRGRGPLRMWLIVSIAFRSLSRRLARNGSALPKSAI